uniref:Uncharacterized protein n=1 Tax=Tetranychus urticae TaxID=32264 RepID=T1JT14_TETUR
MISGTTVYTVLNNQRGRGHIKDNVLSGSLFIHKKLSIKQNISNKKVMELQKFYICVFLMKVVLITTKLKSVEKIPDSVDDVLKMIKEFTEKCIPIADAEGGVPSWLQGTNAEKLVDGQDIGSGDEYPHLAPKSNQCNITCNLPRVESKSVTGICQGAFKVNKILLQFSSPLDKEQF